MRVLREQEDERLARLLAQLNGQCALGEKE